MEGKRMTQANATASTPDRRRWIALYVLCAGMLMIVLDVTVVNVALPSIQEDLGFDQSSLAWVVNGYLITFGGLLLLAGRFGDLLGRKNVFMAGLALFTIASVVCGAAQTQEMLVGGRFVQGIGGAMTSAVILGMIVTMFPEPREQAKAIGVYAFVASAGGTIGLLAGGVLTEAISWHWIFFINVPIGVLAIVAASLLIRESRDTSADQRLDIPGLLTSGIALFALTFALIEANDYGWTSPTILSLFAVTGVSLVAFVLLELHQRAPMLDLALFRSGTFAGANIVALLVFLAMFGVFFFVSLYVQGILGYSAVQAGAMFLPMTVLIMFVAPIAGKLSDRLGSRWLIVAGMAFLVAHLLLLSNLDVDSTFWNILPALILGGFGMGLTMTPATAAAIGSVPIAKAGIGSGVLNTFRQVGGALGIAVMGAIVASQIHVAPAAPAFRDQFMDGFSIALRVAAVIALVGALAAAVLIRKYSHVEAAEVEAVAA
jgi:EmrB/QacA subfamily drug resistance transporter